MSYKLVYFNGMGRAEVARLLFAIGDIEYEDVRLTKEQWMELKPNTLFGQLPNLEVNGETFCQSKAIELLIAKKIGRAGKNDLEEARCHMVAQCVEDLMKSFYVTYSIQDEQKRIEARQKFSQNEVPTFLQKFEKMLQESENGFFVGNDITWADISLFKTVTCLPIYNGVTVDLVEFPKVTALVDKVKADKKIATWIEKRPKTAF